MVKWVLQLCLTPGSYYGLDLFQVWRQLFPSVPYDAKGLLLASIEDADNVVIFSEDKPYGLKGKCQNKYYTVPIGKAAVRREGKD